MAPIKPRGYTELIEGVDLVGAIGVVRVDEGLGIRGVIPAEGATDAVGLLQKFH